MSAPDDHSIGFFNLFHRGQHYSKAWSLEKHPTSTFVKNCVIKMACHTTRFMPSTAIFALCWQIVLGGQLGPVVATALFVLSLLMQGLWWLNKRSVMPLPPAIPNWFYGICGKSQESEQVSAPVRGKPDYQALAGTFRRAFK